MADLGSLEQALGISFTDTSLLRQALVHQSYLNENPGFTLASNERLEFLGDAVLGFIVAGELYQEFPHFDEGELTRSRAALVCRETLSQLALSLGLGDYLYLGQGEERDRGRTKPTNLAGALEAIIGAVFLDKGLPEAKDFILRLLGDRIEKMKDEGVSADYKSFLQERVQAEKHLIPVYRVVEATGPEHDKRFTVEVLVGDMVLGRGSGKSKKAAEAEAACLALERLKADV